MGFLLLHSQTSKHDRLGFALILLSSILLGIWAVKNTIALRNILLVCGAILASIYTANQFKNKSFKGLLMLKSSLPLLMIGLMFIWVVFHYLFLSRYPQEQLQELSSTWLRSLLAAFTAIGTAIAVDKRKELINWLWLGLFCSLLFLLIQYIPKALASHSLFAIDWYGGSYIFQGKINGVLAGSIMIAGLTGGLLLYLSQKNHQRLIYASIFWLSGLLLGMYSYVFIFDARNGIGLTAIIFLAAFLWFFVRLLNEGDSANSFISLKNLLLIALSVISLFAWFGKAHSEKNPGWQNILEDTQLAVQIEKYPNWRDPNLLGYPKTGDGRQVAINTYERAAWATAGLILFAPENPMGIGVMSRSFPRLLKQKFGKDVDYIPSTHSAWVDLTLSYGFPGLVLLLGPLLMIVLYSLCSNRAKEDFSGFRFVMGCALICIYTFGEVGIQHGVEMLIYWSAFLAVLHLLSKWFYGNSPLITSA